MILDKFSNPIFDDQDIFNFIYQNKPIDNITVLDSNEILLLEQITGKTLAKYKKSSQSLKEYDSECQKNWFIPMEYNKLDIESWLLSLCESDIELYRISEELMEYKARDLMCLLKWLKYFVDTCRKNHVLWGVGRGSSTSSYVLYKIGVHKIDCIKYDLDWRDFLRKGE